MQPSPSPVPDTIPAPTEPGIEASTPRSRGTPSRASRAGQKWTRLLHVYTSMVALLLVLFFGATGITLNHPEWTFGVDPTSVTTPGTLTGVWANPDGSPAFLTISEYLRGAHGVKGRVTDFGTDLGDGFISYRKPGYAADVFFDLTTGEYRLTVEQQGWVGVLNELHKGRDSGSSWAWVIDAAGGFLVTIALTGLGLQLLLAKRRRAAMLTALGGVVGAGILVALNVLQR